MAKRTPRAAPGDRCHPIAGEVYSAEGGDRRRVPRTAALGGEGHPTVGVAVVEITLSD